MSCRHRCLRTTFCLCFGSLVLPLACAAQSVPAPRVVELTAPDRIILKATYFGAAQPGPGILLLHQCNRQRRVWDDLAAQLAAAGLNVLTVDFRGYGESGGESPERASSAQEASEIVNEKWPADVDVAFRYLQSQPGVNQAVQLARRHAEVKSLVLLSESTDRAGRKFLHNSPNLPLFLAAADDDPDPGVVEIMHWLYDVSPDLANKFVHYAVGGHGVEMFAAHQELPGMIVEWYNATLRNSPAPPATHALAPWSAESRFLSLADEPDGLRKAEQMFADTRRADPNAVLFSEAIMNRIAYGSLAAGDIEGAIALFQMNVAVYPNSPNVYDSLGDAYLADGQKDLARQSAQKALELLASDTTDDARRRDDIRESAQQKLKQLGSPAP
jgi:pimeloyl-ACP methyl ester carboxylesterase